MGAIPEVVLVIGNGGRECALATSLLESPGVERVLIAPPNWGVRGMEGNAGRITQLTLDISDHAAVTEAAVKHGVQLAVIGPEAPLCSGLADVLRAAGIPTVGPGREAAQLEGSKAYAKEFMLRHGIPTAVYAQFTDYHELKTYIAAQRAPLVLKADGLAAGKGVLICQTPEAALEGAARLLETREFGAAGDRVIVEELLTGREISFTCLVAGGRAQLLAASTDYKRLLDGDQGPNTGGMGNICPTPYATPEIVHEFEDDILAKFVHGLLEDGLDYRGFLFVGAMLTNAGLRVLEFNVRLGDPEAEVVLPLCRGDLARALALVADGELPAGLLAQREGACVAVVLASANYPYAKSEPARIEGLERLAARGLLDGDPPPVRVYFSGVVLGAVANQDLAIELLATGGRVLVVSALGCDLSDARRCVYEAVGNINFEGMKYRSDIGYLG